MSPLRIIEPGRLFLLGLSDSFAPLGHPGVSAAEVICGLWSQKGPAIAPAGAESGASYGLVRHGVGREGEVSYTGFRRARGPNGWVCEQAPARRWAVFVHVGSTATFGTTLIRACRAVSEAGLQQLDDARSTTAAWTPRGQTVNLSIG